MNPYELLPVKGAGAELNGFHLLDRAGNLMAVVPTGAEFASLLKGHVETDLQLLREGVAARGGVLAAADTFEQHRHLQRAEELLAEYERQIKNLRKHVKLMAEEVLADAVGEDDKGTPMENLTVPDRDGDIRISRKFENSYSIDPTALFQAFASMFADQHADAVAHTVGVDLEAENWPGQRAALGVAVAEAIVDALDNVGELGKFEPQVSKVRAYAQALARGGHDGPSAIVSAAIVKTREYKGVSVERKQT
jgi:hypothetical protein